MSDSTNPNKRSNRIGIFAAAGSANRLKNSSANISGSKEILHVSNARKCWHSSMQRLHPALRRFANSGTSTTPDVVVGDYLIDSYLHASIDKCIIVTRPDKTDLLEYYHSSQIGDMDLQRLEIRHSPGTPWTIAHALESNSALSGTPTDCVNVAMGFPDIITSPHDVYSQLFNQLENSSSDVVLGLFRVATPQKYDMVKFEASGKRVTAIEIKPDNSDLEWTWTCAVWKNSFSQYLLDYVSNHEANAHKTESPGTYKGTETYVGDIFIASMASGMRIDCVLFNNGRVLDIGTPDDLQLARSADLLTLFS